GPDDHALRYYQFNVPVAATYLIETIWDPSEPFTHSVELLSDNCSSVIDGFGGGGCDPMAGSGAMGRSVPLTPGTYIIRVTADRGSTYPLRLSSF
ncbi:MAG: hypothetical protein AAGA56_31625, partial [Myxococcota bacterium]